MSIKFTAKEEIELCVVLNQLFVHICEQTCRSVIVEVV